MRIPHVTGFHHHQHHHHEHLIVHHSIERTIDKYDIIKSLIFNYIIKGLLIQNFTKKPKFISEYPPDH